MSRLAVSLPGLLAPRRAPLIWTHVGWHAFDIVVFSFARHAMQTGRAVTTHRPIFTRHYGGTFAATAGSDVTFRNYMNL